MSLNSILRGIISSVYNVWNTMLHVDTISLRYTPQQLEYQNMFRIFMSLQVVMLKYLKETS